MYTGVNRGFTLFDTEEDEDMLRTMVVLCDGATADARNKMLLSVRIFNRVA